MISYVLNLVKNDLGSGEVNIEIYNTKPNGIIDMEANEFSNQWSIDVETMSSSIYGVGTDVLKNQRISGPSRGTILGKMLAIMESCKFLLVSMIHALKTFLTVLYKAYRST